MNRATKKVAAQPIEQDADDKKKPARPWSSQNKMPAKKKAKSPAKVQPQWAGIANKMLGNQ